jgi:hypothetical protein
MVLPHGTLVAVMQGNGLWPMFAFGFGGIFVTTQMYGLDLPRWARWFIGLAYVALAPLVYSQRGWLQINDIVRIPLIEYVLVFVFAGLIGGGLWLARQLRRQRCRLRHRDTRSSVAPVAAPAAVEPEACPPETLGVYSGWEEPGWLECGRDAGAMVSSARPTS